MLYNEWLESFNNTLTKYCSYFGKFKDDNTVILSLYNKNIEPDIAFFIWYWSILQMPV